MAKIDVELVVVGAGLSGLMTALLAAHQNRRVALVAPNSGVSGLWSGCVDIWGSVVAGQNNELLPEWHPFRILDGTSPEAKEQVRKTLEICFSDPENNQCLLELFKKSEIVPNEWGKGRATDGCALSISPGIKVISESGSRRALLVDLFEYRDTNALRTGTNLELWSEDVLWRTATISLPFLPLGASSAVISSRLKPILDGPELPKMFLEPFRQKSFMTEFSPDVVFFPPVLGASVEENQRWLKILSHHFKVPVCETSAVRSGLHGYRLLNWLDKQVKSRGIQIVRGVISDVKTSKGHIEELVTSSGDIFRAPQVILATGRFAGGGLNRVYPYNEAIFDLPVYVEGKPLISRSASDHLFEADYTAKQKIFGCGIGVDESLRGLDRFGEVAYDNLRIVGTLLGNCDPVREGRGFGLSILSAYRAVSEAFIF